MTSRSVTRAGRRTTLVHLPYVRTRIRGDSIIIINVFGRIIRNGYRSSLSPNVRDRFADKTAHGRRLPELFSRADRTPQNRRRVFRGDVIEVRYVLQWRIYAQALRARAYSGKFCKAENSLRTFNVKLYDRSSLPFF